MRCCGRAGIDAAQIGKFLGELADRLDLTRWDMGLREFVDSAQCTMRWASRESVISFARAARPRSGTAPSRETPRQAHLWMDRSGYPRLLAAHLQEATQDGYRDGGSIVIRRPRTRASILRRLSPTPATSGGGFPSGSVKVLPTRLSGFALDSEVLASVRHTSWAGTHRK